MEATRAIPARQAAPAVGAVAAAGPRLAFVDNIRWTVIAMVVLVHACVTYSGVGSWFYLEPARTDMAGSLLMVVYESFSQSFFMGLLFFVAAAFIPAAYDRKGFGRFIGDRLVRLGVPSLVFMLVLDPLTNLIREVGTGAVVDGARLLAAYRDHLLSGRFFGASGPLWFAVALLAFSIVYALVRLAAGRSRRPAPPVVTSGAVHSVAAVLMAIIAAGSFIVRLVQPIGTSVLNMQLCYFTQYVVLFCAGLWAGRAGLLARLPREAGRTWLTLAFAVGVPAWFLLMGLGGVLSGGLDALFGGLHWQAAVYAAWEAFMAVAVSIGLLVLYREKANSPTPVTRLLSRTSFGIYVFHAPILVGVSMLLRSAMIYAPLKALVAAGLAWVASLAFAWLVRAIPGVGKLFA